MEWLMQCLQQLSAHELSQEVARSESSIFMLYALLGIFTKRSVYLLAFFMCFALVNFEVAQSISEYQVYLAVIIIYSYVFESCKTKLNKVCCGILICISITFATDAFLYGVNGYYGSRETVIYNNIESISLYAHLLFICSFVHYTRIRNDILGFFGFVERVTYNGYNMQYILTTFKRIASK